MLQVFCFLGLTLLVLCAAFLKPAQKDPLKDLSARQRYLVLKKLLDLEVKHLGLETPVRLVITHLPPNLNGAYRPNRQEVIINRHLLEGKGVDSKALIGTVCHELFHSKQVEEFLKIDVPHFYQLETKQKKMIFRLGEELLNYKSGGDASYRNQLLERQAQSYANSRWDFYRVRLPDIVKGCTQWKRT